VLQDGGQLGYSSARSKHHSARDQTLQLPVAIVERPGGIALLLGDGMSIEALEVQQSMLHGTLLLHQLVGIQLLQLLGTAAIYALLVKILQEKWISISKLS